MPAGIQTARAGRHPGRLARLYRQHTGADVEKLVTATLVAADDLTGEMGMGAVPGFRRHPVRLAVFRHGAANNGSDARCAPAGVLGMPTTSHTPRDLPPAAPPSLKARPASGLRGIALDTRRTGHPGRSRALHKGPGRPGEQRRLWTVRLRGTDRRGRGARNLRHQRAGQPHRPARRTPRHGPPEAGSCRPLHSSASSPGRPRACTRRPRAPWN